ncbi:MAG: GH25 family lysozyme [Clostridium sp.]
MESRNNKNLKGVDISKWQGNVDFAKIEKAGYDVVILKATEGTGFIDGSFEVNYEKAKKTNLKIGVYHFLSEKSSPKEQANSFYNAIKNKKIDVYPILDVEADTVGRGPKGVTDRCLEFLNEFKNLSRYECIIYTYTSFANSKLDKRLSRYNLWIAHYGVNAPGKNDIWNDWVGFQYTDKEKVPGIASPCDANEFKLEILLDTRVDKNPVSPVKPPVTKPINSTKKNLYEESISGQEVVDLQKELNKAGSNLKVDGLFGESTLKACKFIKKGDNGALVKLIQIRLSKKGFSLSPYNADGAFGDLTEQRIKDFQKQNKLVADGLIGENTMKKLYSR